jgi:hypothetical protein
MAALRAMGSQQGRDVFHSAELQVRQLCSALLLGSAVCFVVKLRQ